MRGTRPQGNMSIIEMLKHPTKFHSMFQHQINSEEQALELSRLKGFATFWEFSFYGQKKVADYEYHSLFAEKIHFHT